MKILIMFLNLLLLPLIVLSQGSNSKKTDALYKEATIQAQVGDLSKAINLLNQILKIDPVYYMAYFGLADIYHGKKENTKEKEMLIKGLKSGDDKFPKGFKYLAELLYNEGNYNEGLENMEHFSILKTPLSAEENRLLESCRFAVQAIKNPVPFKPVNAGAAINSQEDEYWPSLNAESNILVFTRLLAKDSTGKKLPLAQEDFFISKKDTSGWTKAVNLGPPINTEENEGAQCISADGRLLFFTGCNRPDGLGSCDIYMSIKQNGMWSEPVNLGKPVNTNAWESQPSVSSDGQWLYFASNRKGGKGNMDIWRAEKTGITAEGFPVYGKVTNFDPVNTAGNDFSPFIHPDGKTLYFASDYWPGMGGKDLFMFRLDSTKNKAPQNLGYPINTLKNEEGITVEVSGRNAWFFSNQVGFGGRDIFTFELPEKDRPQPVSWVKGEVYDMKTGRLLIAEIVLSDLLLNTTLQRLHPFEYDGKFLFCLPAGRHYGLTVIKAGYLFHTENFDLLAANSRQQPLHLRIALQPIEVGSKTILKNIFFDTDSFRLKPESAGQLAEIIGLMQQNPKMKIEIGGHTDNTGSAGYNLLLSEKRAKEVADFLIESGVAKDRVRSKGYGMTKPIADNSNETGKADNRRTEFTVIGL